MKRIFIFVCMLPMLIDSFAQKIKELPPLGAPASIDKANKSTELRNFYDSKIQVDNTSVDGETRYISVENLTLYQDISNNYKINSAILLFSCTKRKEEEPLFTLSVSITQNHYMVVKKGRKMLIKLESNKVIELENEEDKESEYETYGKMIMLSYKLPVKYIKEIQSQKTLKIRIDTEEGYKDLRLGNNDVSAYISNGYESMIGRLSKSKNIYDGF